MAVAVDGAYYPVAARDQLVSHVMPSTVKKKFNRNRTYSKAKIQEVFEPEALKKSLILDAKSFASSWFEFQDGKFTQHALPTVAQIAPGKDLLVSDFNKDGKADILIIGNDNSPHMETGRLDASDGCLLLGDGKGEFQCPINRTTGFWASLEARRLALVKSGKSNYLVVANNNGPLQFWSVR